MRFSWATSGRPLLVRPGGGSALATTVDPARTFGALDVDAAAALRPCEPVAVQVQPSGRGTGGGFGVVASHDTDGTARPMGSFHVGRTDGTAGAGDASSVETIADQPWASAVTQAATEASWHAGRPIGLEFAIDAGALWFLRVVELELAPAAHLRAIEAMRGSGRISPLQAITLLTESAVVAASRHPNRAFVVGRGLAAAPGVATGRIVLSSNRAVDLADNGQRVILVLEEATPHDLPGLSCSSAVVTRCGGVTSHAAVVSRSLGIPCIVGLESSLIDQPRRALTFDGGHHLEEGTLVTVDGTQGHLSLPTPANDPGAPQEFVDGLLRGLPEQHRGVKVYVNADCVDEVAAGIESGATGVGRCRLDQLLEPRRPGLVRHILQHDRGAAATEALRELRTELGDAVTAVLEAAGDAPVVLRLIDTSGWGPPDAAAAGTATAGHRVARPCSTSPGLLLAQFNAVVDAYARCRYRGGRVATSVLVPAVTHAAEVRFVGDMFRSITDDRSEPTDGLAFGAMVETPRAALDAASIAGAVDVLAVGAIELTARVWGAWSEPDLHRLVEAHRSSHPSHQTTMPGRDHHVDRMIDAAVLAASSAHPDVRTGIVEDRPPSASALCRAGRLGIDFVSVPPAAVLLTRFAAARAAIRASDVGTVDE
ncbi:MAG: PEP-utilizing enzyme [Acidimicrobiales bacterium]